MAEGQRMTAADVVAQVRDGRLEDFVREAVVLVARELMEAEISEQVGAELGEVAPEARVTHRNGYRPRPWETRVGEIELLIPRTRQGSYFPSFLEPRRRSEQAIVAVVLGGVCQRRLDPEGRPAGGAARDRGDDQGPRRQRCAAALDEQVELFRQRPLEGAYPYLWLDAKHVKVRDHGRVVSKALVVAYAVHETGLREVIGLDIGEVESGSFWVEFLRGAKEARSVRASAWRSLISTKALKHAIARVLGVPVATLHGALRQRHARALPPRPPRPRLRRAQGGVQRRRPGPGPRAPRSRPVPTRAGRSQGLPAARRAEEDLIAFYQLPSEHWTKLRSTNPLERVNKEIGRRSDVVGIFPNDASVIRLAGALLSEQNDEWLVQRRYLSVESMALILAATRSQENSLTQQQDKQEAVALNPA